MTEFSLEKNEGEIGRKRQEQEGTTLESFSLFLHKIRRKTADISPFLRKTERGSSRKNRKKTQDFPLVAVIIR